MTAPRPVWFGSGRPKLGWLHVPADGRARAGVLICPPLAGEGIVAHRVMRKLAGRLADHGLVALRLDYDGTGDSAGTMSDPDRPGAFRQTVAEAAELLRSAGAPRLAAVGMRLGAAMAAAEPGLDALVLWDPCRSGSTFFREQRMLGALTAEASGLEPPPEVGDGSVEIPGFLFPPSTAEEVRSIRLELVEPSPSAVLVLEREDRPSDGRLHRSLEQALGGGGAGPGLEVRACSGQAELLDVPPPFSRVPAAAVDQVTAWLDAALPREATPFRPPAAAGSIEVGPGGVFGAVKETPRFLGELGLFCIETRAEHSPKAPTLVFLNMGTEPHLGPGRAWVDWSRALAASGLSCARLDLSGLGESPTRPGQVEHMAYAPQVMDDLAQAGRDLQPADPGQVVLAGVCAGAHASLRSGLALGVAGVCAVNPYLMYRPPEAGWDRPPDDSEEAGAPPGRQPPGRNLGGIKPFIPEIVWNALDRLGLKESPARVLGGLAAGGTRTLLVLDEYAAWPVRERCRGLVRRKGRQGLIEVAYLGGNDHALVTAAARERCRLALFRFMTDAFGPEPARPGS